MLDTLLSLAGLPCAIAALWWVWFTIRRSDDGLRVRIYEAGDGAPGVAFMSIANHGPAQLRVVTAGLEIDTTSGVQVFHLRGQQGTSLSREFLPMPPFTIDPGRSWTQGLHRFEITELCGAIPHVRPFACVAEGDDYVGGLTELWGPDWERRLKLLDAARRSYRP